MKIVLVNLPWRSFGKIGVRAGSRWPHLKGAAEADYLPFPFFLAYAAALLKKHHFEVSLIDAIAEEMFYTYCLRLIERARPDMLVCETSTVTLGHDLRLLQKLKTDIPITLCGPDVNIRQPAFLASCAYIDYVLAGEYEFTLLDLATHLRDSKPLDGVCGLIWRDGGKVRVNPARPLADIDTLPWPLREGLPINRYNDSPGDLPLPSVQMLASRGCPYRCAFCLWPQVMYQGRSYRTRDVVDVVDEMEYLVRQMHFKSVYFDDDTFNCGKERMLQLCAQIKKRALKVPWAIMARADLMDEEILEHMQQAGLFAVKYGVESATQELLDNINKNMDLKKSTDIIRLTNKMGIKTHLTFTFGLPGETRQSIERTIDFALRLEPTSVQFSITTPFPGTTFYKEAKEKGYLVSENWLEYDGNHRSVISYRDVAGRDLEEAIRRAYRRWVIHAARKYPSKIRGYYRLLMSSLRKRGAMVTWRSAGVLLLRPLSRLIRERFGPKEALAEKAKENGLQAGRLLLLCENGSLRLYWDGIELTRSAGFFSFFEDPGDTSRKPSACPWQVKKVNDLELLLTRMRYGQALEESWKIKVLDEKQIDWDIEISLKDQINALTGKIMLILSGRYRTWVDAWGEGRLYPVHMYRKIKLRNPRSDFIGLRGRKHLAGELPTVFLDLSRNSSQCLPLIQNARSALGARVLAAQTRIANGNGAGACGVHKAFSVRIKIVEKDFDKRRRKNSCVS
ncbi:MAG TPA: radical SAM protein [Patescibacteria group bacterium]|nr:radical SAM protein [Patescibacteria group bacterium]